MEFELNVGNKKPKKDKKQDEDVNTSKTRSVQVFKNLPVNQKLKLLSEKSLDDALDWHFEDNTSYHCISFGDVDSLSYLRHILKQQKLEYCLLSTWCMANEDVKEIDSWLERGLIKHIDFYVGEIFSGGYRGAYDLLLNICYKYGGRVAVFRNHSKIMVGKGEQFDFVIESSANVNTNPRCEQTVITVDTDLMMFYKNFFDGINAFNKEFKEWKPYKL